VHAGYFVLRHGEHAKGVFGAQIVLGGEREVAQVAELAEVAGVDSGVVELALVEGDTLVGVGHGVLQAAQLQCLEFVAGDGLLAVQSGILARFGGLRQRGFGGVEGHGFLLLGDGPAASAELCDEFPRLAGVGLA
jgi:hypothetical protein